MEEKFNLITFENKIPLTISVVKFDYIYRHMHSMTELIIVLKGKCDVFIENKEYQAKEDDIFIVNPFTFHHIISNKGAILLSCKIDQKGFGMEKEEADNLSFSLNSMENPNNKRLNDIKYLIFSLAKFNTKENVNSLFTNKAICYSLFAQLLNDFRVSDSDNLEIAKNYSISTKLNDYIIAHYNENITLEMLSSEFNYSVSYLSRFFKQSFGKNFSEYYDSLRINYSLFDLISTQKSIDDIAIKHGFPNARSYVRAFKSLLNEYPSDYRKNNRGVLKINNSKSDDLIKESLDIIIKKYDYMHKIRKEHVESVRDIDLKTSINLDAQAIAKNNHPYNKLLGLSSAKLILIDEVRKGLSEIQNEIHFEYITLAHVADPQLGLVSKDHKTFTGNYLYLDRIINFLMSINLHPLIKFEIALSDDKEVFLDFVKSLLTHYIQIYGINYASTFRFSLKIHEDLTTLNQREIMHFFDIYNDFYCFIKSINPEIQVTTINFSKKDILNTKIPVKFFEYIKSRKIHIDCFLIDYLGNENVIHKNKQELMDFINYLIINQMFFKKKVIIENINFTKENNLLNDTLYSSSYLVKNYLDSIQLLGGFSKLGLTDLDDVDNIKDYYLYHGGNGYFTSNAIKKASFNALIFISKLEPEIIELTSNYIVTRTENKIVILINNYNHYSNLYADQKYFELTKTNRYDCFPKSTNIHFSLNINKVLLNKCRITETKISENSGSSYDIFLTFGAPSLLKFTEEESLKKLSEPRFNIKELEVKNNSILVETTVRPLETKLIEIEFYKDYV